MTYLLQFEPQYVFYAAYHRQKWNVLHSICIPALVWTVGVWLSNTGDLAPGLSVAKVLPAFNGWAPEANGAFFGTIIYLAYYAILEPGAALFMMPIWTAMYLSEGWFLATVPNANVYALYLHIAAWVVQILGHVVFEGRAPAFTESLWQAVVVAPLFVWVEILFALGYKPDLVRKLDVEIKKAQAIKFGTTNKGK
ncbi:hypothetical protein GGF31_001648 [Allomyces arbusculus]|nr:hypothetical protein GGF31_001648 [Allomyces arbusculus]